MLRGFPCVRASLCVVGHQGQLCGRGEPDRGRRRQQGRRVHGRVIDQKAFTSITGAIQRAADDDGCEIVTGGTWDDSTGWFIQPTTIVCSIPCTKRCRSNCSALCFRSRLR